MNESSPLHAPKAVEVLGQLGHADKKLLSVFGISLGATLLSRHDPNWLSAARPLTEMRERGVTHSMDAPEAKELYKTCEAALRASRNVTSFEKLESGGSSSGLSRSTGVGYLIDGSTLRCEWHMPLSEQRHGKSYFATQAAIERCTVFCRGSAWAVVTNLGEYRSMGLIGEEFAEFYKSAIDRQPGWFGVDQGAGALPRTIYLIVFDDAGIDDATLSFHEHEGDVLLVMPASFEKVGRDGPQGVFVMTSYAMFTFAGACAEREMGIAEKSAPCSRNSSVKC